MSSSDQQSSYNRDTVQQPGSSSWKDAEGTGTGGQSGSQRYEGSSDAGLSNQAGQNNSNRDLGKFMILFYSKISI
ncbi:unnamed protein product [Rotaria sordida]|uniref:Uncharacterized protein n=1 Tax=Rotaria sordida TaxID=392033 RepID=A0A815HNH1_9BILA|nr:unnamed protein product [Rotaria sordida]